MPAEFESAPEEAVQEEAAASAPPVGASELSAFLAARLCHDIISPASAIVSGLDLLEDPTAQDMRDDAMNLIGSSARKLVAMLAFARVAFGASASAERFDCRELERLTRGVFDHVRPDVEWSVELESLNKAASRALLNLAQLGAGALPTGGLARIIAVEDGEHVQLIVDARGTRARLRPEIMAGLRGERLTEGMSGHWVQAYYLRALLDEAGGEVAAAAENERVLLTARVPI